MRVAVAASEGSSITQHFGRARLFHIFDLLEGKIQLIEKRRNAPACHCGDHEVLLAGSVEAISDCDIVVASRLGPGAREALAERGIRFAEIYDFIGRAVERLSVSTLGVPRKEGDISQ